MRTRASPAPSGRRDRDHHPGRGLVVGPGDHVGGGVGDRRGRIARLGLDQDRVAEERRALGRLGELLRELAVGEVQGALTHQPGTGGVPEGGRAAVAESDLVAVGQGEKLAEPERTRPTRSRTGAWRCEVPISADCPASFSSASGRTFDGPQPKRPSAGLSSVGIWAVSRSSRRRRQVSDRDGWTPTSRRPRLLTGAPVATSGEARRTA